MVWCVDVVWYVVVWYVGALWCGMLVWCGMLWCGMLVRCSEVGCSVARCNVVVWCAHSHDQQGSPGRNPHVLSAPFSGPLPGNLPGPPQEQQPAAKNACDCIPPLLRPTREEVCVWEGGGSNP